jgi:HSP20 family protein
VEFTQVRSVDCRGWQGGGFCSLYTCQTEGGKLILATEVTSKKVPTQPTAPKAGALTPIGHPSFLSRLREDFDRLFEPLMDICPIHGTRHGWRWGMEIDDGDDALVVRAEAPGFEAGDFDLRVEDNRLVLRASKKIESKNEKGQVQEFRQQEYCESVALPTGIDKDKVEAKYHNGVLTVTLPRTAEGKARKITVKAE